MGRSAYCSKDADLKRGAWTAQEDFILREYITMHGDGGWRSLPQKAGLKRCGKSCRLRWLNYLRADINRGNISPDEEELIVRLHRLLGNRWSLIAGRLPGRTDNQIKNYWNIHLSKKQKGEKKTLPSSPTRSKPAPPVVHRDLKTNPVKATAVRVAKGCNKSESSSSSNHQGLESTVRIIVESQCNPNTTNGYSSSSSYDLVHNNNENEVVTSECLLHLKGMSSPEFDLLQSPQDLRFQKLEATSSNVMEQMRSLESSMPQGKTFTGWGKPYNETKVVDWIDELQSLHKSSMQWLSLLELDSENDW